MKRKLTLLTLLLLSFCLSISAQSNKAKYVFYFIGDGMGFSHVSIAEAYSAYLDGVNGSKSLSFTQFPVLGMATTFSASNMITCSSASGTALATGHKTNNGFLGIAPDSTNLKSIAYTIHDAGYRVGVTSNVGINHATPASFYANAINRGLYYDIALQLPTTGFEFFGGGGFISPNGSKNDQPSAYDSVEKNGYVIAAGLDDYKTKKSASKMLFLSKEGKNSKEYKYAIDREEGDIKLADLVETAVDFLDNGENFFLMCEGGKIDWAAHGNDAKADIMEVIDLSEAVAVAYNFFLKHPDETLIIVTADHETGGFAMGRKGYNIYFDKLNEVHHSKEYYNNKKISKEIDKAIKEARLGWTTSSHSGSAVPVFSIGVGSQLFSGKMDNTDIPKKVCEAMGVKYE